MHNDFKKNLENLYFLLRDEGFSLHSNEIKKLIYYIETENKKEFTKAFSSSIIWGGAGSILDIEIRDNEKQKKLDVYISNLKIMKSKYNPSIWNTLLNLFKKI